MLFARGAVRASYISEKRDGIQVECTATESRILLPASCMYCCSLDLQQHIMLICAREDCAIRTNSTQGTIGVTGVLIGGLVLFLLDD